MYIWWTKLTAVKYGNKSAKHITRTVGPPSVPTRLTLRIRIITNKMKCSVACRPRRVARYQCASSPMDGSGGEATRRSKRKYNKWRGRRRNRPCSGGADLVCGSAPFYSYCLASNRVFRGPRFMHGIMWLRRYWMTRRST
jgi:hypothetical protein